MAELQSVQSYYQLHPRMVSSPFGGVDFFDRALWEEVCGALELDFAGRKVLDVGCGRALCERALRSRPPSTPAWIS